VTAQAPDRIDLVIPVYNEAHVLESTVDRIFKTSLQWTDISWRILIVDNASIDGTDEVGRRLAEKHEQVDFHRLDIKGRGHALRWAWNETESPFSLYMDVDLSTDLSGVPVAMSHLRDGADLVTGSRLDPASDLTRSVKREFFSRTYNFLVGLGFPSRKFSDAQCGFKGIRVETVRPLLALVKNNHWFFDTELMLLAEYAGLDVRCFPITWVEDTDSRVNILQYSTENLKGMARLRFTMKALLRDYKR